MAIIANPYVVCEELPNKSRRRRRSRYTAIHNRTTYLRGDTVDGFTFRLTDKEREEPVVPLSLCIQIKSSLGRVVHEYEVIIQTDGWIIVPPVLADWEVGVYKYDVEYRLGDYSVRTYLEGTLPIVKDISEC